MKKLAVLMIAALAMLMVPAMASANWYYWWGIQGDYEMVANGSCLHSPLGFDLSSDGVYTPKPSSPVWAATTFAEATWTFGSDGKGTVSGWNYVVDFPPGRPIGDPSTQTPGVRKNPITFTFRYSLEKNGEISAAFINPDTNVPLPAPPMYGKVSIDRRTITLWSAYELQQGGTAICNTGRTLIRVSE